MKLAVLFSGGKDSTLAIYLAKQLGYEISCLIAIDSENKESFMFHTPSISKTKKQAETMEITLILHKTKGKKEKELKDLKKAIKIAIKDYQIEGVITGAVESVYQASRVQTITNDLKIECFNPLWQKDQIEVLNDLIKYKFEVILSGVFAYPFNKSHVGKKIDEKFINELKKLQEEYQINPAGEGGEFETLVLNCPLFKKPLKIKEKLITGSKHAYRMEAEIDY